MTKPVRIVYRAGWLGDDLVEQVSIECSCFQFSLFRAYHRIPPLELSLGFRQLTLTSNPLNPGFSPEALLGACLFL